MFVWFFFVHQLMGYRLVHFLKDIVPFALAASGVMMVTGQVTEFIVYSLQFTDDYLRLWVLLLSRVIIAAILYYAVMRLSGAIILKECLAFIKKSSINHKP
jgi:vacuolar-type H+-ATPase subunit I/STV1